MSIPTQVFENGRWITRYADIHHVLAQNRDPETITVKKAVETPKPPSLGLLTKTIVRSPVVQWIIPARIRHPDKNDVLYITADSVEIREAHGDYTLHHVAIKDDFDSPIKAARICGLQRELTKPDINAIIRKEEHWQDDVHYDHSDHADQSMDQDTDVLIKEEIDEMTGIVEDSFGDADVQSMRAVPLHTRSLSPHLLILALDSGKLVFMYTVNGDAETPHIVTSQRPLWKGQRPLLDQIGRHIAVDPRSRAIAVAAQENAYYVYTLRPMTDLQNEVRKRPEIHPIVSEHAFEVDGTILKMEFLYAPQDDPDQVILLLVVCKNSKSRLIWYEWNSTSPLAQAHMKPLSQVLPTDERMPLLLIPTIAFTAFILVCENRITLYRDLLTGTPTRYIHKLHEVQEPEEAGSSKKRPLWVQWARVLRSTTHRAQGDGVYLCREDGIIHFLDIKYGRPSLIDSTHQVGKLGTNIDTCFAVIDVGPHGPDLLAAGGDSSEGGLWKFDAREHPTKISKDPSWTPVVDCCTAMVTKTPQMTDVLSNQSQIYQQRIFACVGKAKQGALSEIRFGIPALRSLTIPLKDILDGGILAVWALRNAQLGTSYIVLSHPKQTYLLRIQLDGDENRNIAELVEETKALRLNERTIAIKALVGGRIVQVTERAVWVSSFGAIDNDNPEELSCHTFDSARVLAACIGVPGPHNLTLVAFETHGKFYLQLAEVIEMYQVIGEALEIGYQPTAVALAQFADDIFVIVGAVHETINVWIVKKDSQEWEFGGRFDFGGGFAICESIVVSPPAVGGDDAFPMLIACGMRDGSVQIIKFRRRGIAYQSFFYSSEALGETPVTITAAIPDPIRFITQVEDQTFTLEYCSPEKDTSCAKIHRVWFTDDEKPEWQPRQLSVMTVLQDPETQSSSMKACELVCIDREFIHVAQLNYAGGPKNVPRRLQVCGTPTRAIYSEKLCKIIVLSHQTSVSRHPRTVGGRTHPGKRTLRPVIMFLDPNSACDESLDEDAMDIDPRHSPNVSGNHWTRSSSQHDRETPPYEPGERFLGIAEWFPKVGDKEFHMLIVHTMIKADDIHVAKSRLLLFSLHVDGEHNRLTLKKDTTPSMPIYAVAVHPNRSSIVYHAGDELRILGLEATDTGFKWSAPIKAQLRSPARHITIKLPYIYVSTAGNSLAVFLEKDGLLEFLANDTVARQGFHHINLPAHDLTVVADMGSSITGLWKPPHPPRIDHSLSTLFEASLPQASIRLLPVRFPIWYRDRKAEVDSEAPEEVEHEWLHGRRVLIGIATTGTITQHRLLLPDQWPFLRFLQNLAESSHIICPFPNGPNQHHLDPARSTNPEIRAINGDILARLLSRGGHELIWNLMNKSPALEERYLDFDSVKDRWERFKELFSQFLTTFGAPPDPNILEDDMQLASLLIMILDAWLLNAL